MFFSCFMFAAFSGTGQTVSDTLTLDLLKAPASPAFNLLGIASSDIERPTDLTAFAFSVQNNTNSFTKIPSNYAAEFSPGWLGGRNNMTLDKFNSINFRDIFWQSFSVSFGLSRQDEEGNQTDEQASFTKTGVGIKFSLIRPTWTGETKAIYNELTELMNVTLRDNTLKKREAQRTDLALADLDALRVKTAQDASLTRETKLTRMIVLDAQITARKAELNDSLDNEFFQVNEHYKSLTQKASDFKVERNGIFLDFSGGVVLDFPDENFNNSSLSKAGGWLTGGYEGGNKNVSILGIARYLFNPDKVFSDDSGLVQTSDISTLDAGARLIFKGAKGKFNASTEGIYRSILNEDAIDPSWRLVLNAEYDIGINQKLTFAFGRNFDRTISRNGNLITALNFIAGFGNKRRF